MIPCFCFYFVSFATRRAPSMKTARRSNAKLWARSVQCRWTHKDRGTQSHWPWTIPGGQDLAIQCCLHLDFPVWAVSWNKTNLPQSQHSRVICSSRASQVLVIYGKMSDFLHLALRLSITQTTFPAFSLSCPISKLLANSVLHSCLILGSITLLWAERFLCPLFLPWSPFILWSLSQFLSPSYGALGSLQHSDFSPQGALPLYILPIENSSTWFFIIGNIFVCSHCIGAIDLSAA